MAKRKDNNVEKRRKGIELVFDLMFWFIVIDAIFEIVNLLSGKGDVVRLVVALVLVGVMFAGARLAHNGNMVAGVVGIIVGGVVFLTGGIIFNILGALLVIDSIAYLIVLDKK